ncbi:MAG: hypothetical protein AAF549_07245 [Pseudomonadota bacterium]
MLSLSIDFEPESEIAKYLAQELDAIKAGAVYSEDFIQCGQYRANKTNDGWDVEISRGNDEWENFSSPPWQKSAEEVLNIFAFETLKLNANAEIQRKMVEALIVTLSDTMRVVDNPPKIRISDIRGLIQ